MTTEVKDEPQSSFEDAPVEDMNVEVAINRYVSTKDSIEDAKEAFRNAEKVLQGVVGEKDLIDGKYRFGPYVLTVSHVAAHARLRVKKAKSK